eukprot:TRINITY_DN10035_c0_g2_i1.p4 TRINITY_DN10035_c0_g2~~TRINITY_DN10035_c0_g2_i1.p4  ORF type:complete len:124 (-),score=6.28 TRINITY_DN10035_c0_g2_i1:463-834(-)
MFLQIFWIFIVAFSTARDVAPAGTTLQDVEYAILSSMTMPMFPRAFKVALQKPCLLMSFACNGKPELTGCLPCCCEHKVEKGDNLVKFVSLSKKFKTYQQFLEWNGIKSSLNKVKWVQVCPNG